MPQIPTWPVSTSRSSDLVRQTNWAATPLGPVDAWPAGLRTTVDTLLACSFPMVALWGPELVQIYNDSFAEIMGQKHPAGMGQPTSDCWPEVWKFNEAVYRQVLQGQTLTFENQLFPIARHGTLEDAYFTLCYSPLRDDSQEVAGVLVTVFETTERVKAEATLLESAKFARENEHRFRAFLEATSDAVYTMSADWTEMRSLDGNQFLADTDDSSATWWNIYIPDDARPRVRKAIERAIQTGSMFDLEHPVIGVDGKVAWTHSRAVPLRNDQGEITEWIGAAANITSHREAEALRTAVAKRDTLLAEVHHRVKNNLQVITSMLEMQGRHAGDPRSHSALKEACNRVASIAGIHEILYQSKSYSSVNLLGYAQQLVPHLVTFYGAKDRIVTKVEGNTATLELERAVPFGLLLNELVSNACKHAFKEGTGGQVVVQVQQADSEICLDVTDDGVGLPAGFDYRTSTGLGLQIVGTLTQQVKGDLRFLSAHSGTHVRVCIPKHPQPASDPA
jgi:two-component sensor histidine kinase/PAS domain-containing protein